MPEVHPLVRKLIPLPPQVRNHLHQVAKKQARLGVRMFLFGSVARTWPQTHIGADLDIGYEIDGRAATASKSHVRLTGWTPPGIS